MAKDLKAFMKKASEDKGLAKKVNKAKNEQELRSIMASEGFELTDADINNVSGGFSWKDFKNGASKLWGGIRTGLDKAPEYMDKAQNIYNQGKDLLGK